MFDAVDLIYWPWLPISPFEIAERNTFGFGEDRTCHYRHSILDSLERRRLPEFSTDVVSNTNDSVGVRGGTVFFIPWAHFYAVSKRLEPSHRDWQFSPAEIMLHLLVPLDEVSGTIEMLVKHNKLDEDNKPDAPTFWGAFPGVNDNSHRYTYSILIDEYDEHVHHRLREDPLNKTRMGVESDWMSSMPHPLLKEVDTHNLGLTSTQVVLMMNKVETQFRDWGKRGCPMIREWRFVTWNKG